MYTINDIIIKHQSITAQHETNTKHRTNYLQARPCEQTLKFHYITYIRQANIKPINLNTINISK